ncbi:MAG: hypothetical protein LBF22_15640 [Deltaproteobacteria bacterium]|jgi:hypothetical protein|nr:hypothetical protein [Deltaproteobacteria bacterium]
MRSNIIFSASLRDYLPLIHEGTKLIDRYESLKSLLASELPPDRADLLAEPVTNKESGFLNWYTSLSGVIKPWDSLSESEQKSGEDLFTDRLQELKDLSERLLASTSQSQIVAGNYLQKIIKNSNNFVRFMVDDRLVVANWGMGAKVIPASVSEVLTELPGAGVVTSLQSGRNDPRSPNGSQIQSNSTPPDFTPPQESSDQMAQVTAQRTTRGGWDWLKFLLLLLLPLLLLSFLLFFILPRLLDFGPSLDLPVFDDRGLSQELSTLRDAYNQRLIACNRDSRSQNAPDDNQPLDLRNGDRGARQGGEGSNGGLQSGIQGESQEGGDGTTEGDPLVIPDERQEGFDSDEIPLPDDGLGTDSNPQPDEDLTPDEDLSGDDGLGPDEDLSGDDGLGPDEDLSGDDGLGPEEDLSGDDGLGPDEQNLEDENQDQQDQQDQQENLQIPPSANNSDDLSFLQGCWNSNSTLFSERNRLPLKYLYCFDDKGQGRVTMQMTDDQGKTVDICTSTAKARLQEGSLSIDEDGVLCRSGNTYLPTTINCKPGESDTECQVRQRGRKNLQTALTKAPDGNAD